jgi:uncharacterized membrane protein
MILDERSARELGKQLRTGDSPVLRRRRQIAGLSLFSIGMMGFISLYQTGIVRRLPDLPFSMFDANAVDAAPEAYEFLSTPDAVLGIVNYAATLALAATGPEDRTRIYPVIPLVMAGKTLADSLSAGKLTLDQWTKHRTFCIWCLLGAASTFATVPLALPEAREGFRNLLGSERR